MTEVTVVVICRNEEAYIQDCLHSLTTAAAHFAGQVEIVLVDGLSTDDTVALTGGWKTLRVVNSPVCGYSRQRNVGVQAASHSWIAFVSADVRVPPSWLSSVQDEVDGSADVLIGRFNLVTPPGRLGWMRALAPTLYPTCTDSPAVERFSTVHLFIRRRLLLETPFNERLDSCEDKDLAYRLRLVERGIRVGEVTVRPQHLARESFVRFLRKLAAEGRALGSLAGWHGSAFPDCFGWGAASVRSAVLLGAGVALSVVAGFFTGSPWLESLPLAAWLITANWQPQGWRRRGETFPIAALALAHIVATLTISLGYLTGRMLAAAQPRPDAIGTRTGGDEHERGSCDIRADRRGPQGINPTQALP
jgi:hypothetical protein